MRLLVLFLYASTSLASTLNYRDGDDRYDLHFSEKELSYFSPQSHHDFQLRDCNKVLLKAFWKDVVYHVKHLPVLKKSSGNNSVELDSEARALWPGEHTHYLHLVPQEIKILEFKEMQACSRH